MDIISTDKLTVSAAELSLSADMGVVSAAELTLGVSEARPGPITAPRSVVAVAAKRFRRKRRRQRH